MQNREKHKITYMHFILSVLVILIHSINNETRFEKLFSIDYGIGQFAVPLFFVISGFLFFKNVGNVEDVKNKLNRRVHTLFVPFMLWNTIYYFIHLLINPGLGIDFQELFQAAFNYKYNPAFWFMYQLILLSILSLLFIRVLRNKNRIVIFYIIIATFIIKEWDIPYVNEDAIIYYFTGAVAARLYDKNKVNVISKKDFLYSLVISIACFVANRVAYGLVGYNFIFRTLFILTIILVRLSFAITIFYFCDIIFNYQIVPNFMEQNFFLYATHYMIVKAMIIFMKFFTYKYLPNQYFLPIEIAVFVLSPVVCVIVSSYVSKYMLKNFNKAYKTLVGNR